MHKGDQRRLPIRLTDAEGRAITPDTVDDVMITVEGVGSLTIGDGLTFEDGYFMYPLTQEQTMSFGQTVRIQARIKQEDTITCSECVYMWPLESVGGLWED